jgi:peptidyl-prolyl cis-trans isomerase A (cyclophilin A)
MFKLLTLCSVVLFGCSVRNPKVIMETELGNITIEIYEKKAPVTAANFLRYVDEKRFAGAVFYRVVTMENQPNNDVKIEVIQGGLFEDDHKNGLPPIIHETTGKTGILHKDGVISMARLGPGTASAGFLSASVASPNWISAVKEIRTGRALLSSAELLTAWMWYEKYKSSQQRGSLNPRIYITQIVRVK